MMADKGQESKIVNELVSTLLEWSHQKVFRPQGLNFMDYVFRLLSCVLVG